jgi:hypothetical protein
MAITAAVTGVSGTFVLGETVYFTASSVLATLTGYSAGVMSLSDLTGLPTPGGQVRGVSSTATANVASITSTTWASIGAEVGHALVPLDGFSPATILAIDGVFAWVSADAPVGTTGGRFRVIDASSADLFNPTELLVPFGSDVARDLATTIGSSTVRLLQNIQSLGVTTADTFEILEGLDIGTYAIRAWDPTLGGMAPVLDRAMRSTGSNLTYRVFRRGTGLPRPLTRILPGGVDLTAADGTLLGTKVPYALPVAAWAQTALQGAVEVGTGTVGFVLPDPGDAWAATSNVSPDLEDAHAPYSSGYVDSDGVIAVCTLLDDGTFYVNADLPTGVAEFITNLQSYFRDVGTAFGFGDDYTALVDGLLPFNLAAPPEGAPQLFQFEILLPPELFDGVNNCFVSLPEIRWDELFASSGTFSEAIQEFQNGAAVGTASPLASAQPGDALTILAGANAGSYRIRKVLTYYIATPGTIVDGEASLSRCYKVTMVIIDGAFPAAPLEGLAAFLTTGMEALVDTGVAPTFPGTATDADGNAASPWAWVQLAMTYFFNRMTLYGFSYPSAFTLDPGVTLATLWRALFVGYTVARPSGTGVLRFAWVEPTGVRLRASMVSETITYQLPVAEAPTVTGARITLPLHDLEDLILTITLDGITLAATLDSAAAALSTLEELAAWLQDVLDPAGAYLTVEGPATQSGALTFTGRPFANPSTLTVDTTSTPNAALLLGFWDATGSPAELTASGMPAAVEDVFDRVELTTSMTGFIALQTTVSTVDTDHQIEWTTEISEDRLYGFHEIAAMLETKMAAVLTAAYPSEDLEVTVVYALFNRFEITITGTNLTAWSLIQPANPVDFSPQIFGASIGATIHTSGYPATGSPLKVIGGLPYFYARAPRLGYLSGYTLAGDGAADADDWEISARLVDYQTAFEDVVPVIEACILASDTTALAAYMNATEAFYASDGSRRVVYVGGDTGILVRSIQIGRAFTLTSTDNPSLTTSAASGANAYAIGIMSATGDIDDGNSTDTGGQTAGEEQTRVVNARDATRARHVTASGAVIDYEVQVEEGDEGSTILPLPVGSNEITVGQYPRDGSCETIPDDSSTMRVRFTGEGTAPVSAMVRAGDILDIYPQRVLLTQEDPIAASLKGVDRPIGLVTRAGSNVLTLPQHLAGEFNLLSPQSRPEDAVAAGDILWVEEGPDVGAFTVVQVVDTHTLIVDRPLTTSTQPILRTGCTAELTMGRSDVRIYELTPKASDVGYWLVLWGARTDTTIGCFRITALTPPTSTDPRFWTLALDMDADFETTEDNLMWAIIQPPAVAPGDSGVSGRTELLGVVPVRIYRGTATALTIAHVHPALKREESWVACADAANALTDGHKNPHRIRRLGEYVVPANVMAQQIDGGLYYVDVPVRTVSAAIRDALPTLTRLEPVVGTFDADGYWLETEDTRTSWSVLEQTRIYMSREVQRDTQAGDGTDRATLEGASLQVQAEWGSVLARVQANLNGAEDRQLCASYLVRGYLLAYVYLNANVSGGESASAAAKAIQEWINGLNADDDLRVSSIHGILHRHGYSTYRSPIELLSVTHDLDRRLVGWRSFDRLTDAEVPYHGSSRITAYVAGPDRSAVADAVDVPPGERIRLSGGEQDA